MCDLIRIEISRPGHDAVVQELDSCPIIRRDKSDDCPLTGSRCRYGLTDITPPPTCPMKQGTITIRFSIIPPPSRP